MHEEGKRRGPRMRWMVDRHIKPIYQALLPWIERAQANGLLPADIAPVHFVYILAGSAGVIFHQAEECKRLSGTDPADPAVIDAHARAVESPLSRPPRPGESPMKLCTFTHGIATRIGVVDGDAIVDLAPAAPGAAARDARIPGSRPRGARRRARRDREGSARPALGGTPRSADRAAAEVPGGGPQLRRPRRGGGPRNAEAPDDLQQAVDLRGRPVRSRPHPACVPGRSTTRASSAS